MSKKQIMMLYPTIAEASRGYEKVFLALREPLIQSRKFQMLETESAIIDFRSISANFYAWINGHMFDEVWIDERIDVNAQLNKNQTLESLIYSRKR